jgi:hypothetical protein
LDGRLSVLYFVSFGQQLAFRVSCRAHIINVKDPYMLHRVWILFPRSSPTKPKPRLQDTLNGKALFPSSITTNRRIGIDHNLHNRCLIRCRLFLSVLRIPRSESCGSVYNFGLESIYVKTT